MPQNRKIWIQPVRGTCKTAFLSTRGEKNSTSSPGLVARGHQTLHILNNINAFAENTFPECPPLYAPPRCRALYVLVLRLFVKILFPHVSAAAPVPPSKRLPHRFRLAQGRQAVGHIGELDALRRPRGVGLQNKSHGVESRRVEGWGEKCLFWREIPPGEVTLT